MLAKTSAEAAFLELEPFKSASGMCGEVRTASFVVFGGGFFVALSSSSLNERLVNVSIVAVLTFRKTTVDDRNVRSFSAVSFRDFAVREDTSSLDTDAPVNREKKVRRAGAWSLFLKLSKVEAPDRGNRQPTMSIQLPSS